MVKYDDKILHFIRNKFY